MTIAKNSSSSPGMKLLWAVRIFIAAGAVFAGYLWSLRAGHAAHPGCHASGDCSHLWFSSWGSWLGVPVSALALIPYALATLGTFLVTGKRSAEMGRFLLAGVGSFLPVLVLWFIILQGTVIKQWCRLCLLSHAISVGLSLLIFLWLKAENHRPVLGAWFRGRAVATGLALGLAAVAGHSIFNPRADSGFKPIPGLVALQRPSAERLQIFDREVDFKQEALIVSGTFAAPEIMVVLADYTCPECRRLHLQMQHVLASQPGRYLEVVLPAPLSSKCNPAVTNDTPEHENACEIARIACVIGRRRPDAFPEFHHWLMKGAQVPDLGVIRQRAQSLLGSTRLENELTVTENFGPLGLGLWTFQTNLNRNRLAALPVTMTSKAMFIGAPASIETWIQKLN